MNTCLPREKLIYVHENAHYMAKVVTEEEKEGKKSDPTDYTRKAQTNKQTLNE